MPVTEEQGQVAALGVEAAPVAAAEQPVAEAFDLSTTDGIRRAAEKYPTLQQWREEGFNAGKLKRDKELRDQLGSEDAVKSYHEQVVRRIASGEDPSAVLKETPQYVKANRDAYWRGEVEKVIDAFSTDEQAQIRDALEAAEDVDSRERVSRQVLDFAIDRHSTNRIKSLKLADVPEDSELRKSIAEHVAAELAKERAALEQELKPKPLNPPTTPTGESMAGGDALSRFNQMTPAQRTDYMETATDEQKSALWAAAAPR